MKKYNKVLVFQYGKVGSTSIRRSTKSGKYCPTIQDTYKEHILQTHSHEVANDILQKYNNILVINTVRLPIDRNISAFCEGIHIHAPNYKKLSIEELIDIYDQNTTYSVKYTDDWMLKFPGALRRSRL